VTGGTRGIGAAIAVALMRSGYEVSVSGRSENGQAPEGCDYLACDFEDSGRLRAFTEEVSRSEFDVLVNNAGINKIGVLTTYDPKDFERIHRVNVMAPFMLCQAVVPGMCDREFGRIVNITSIWGVVSRPERAAYSASKFALFGLSRALALEVANKNVLVNCVAPGFIDTDLTRQVLGLDGITEVEKQIPLGRLARPEEIAAHVNFLASEHNTYMTGQNIVVDGGFVSA
jgi:NAD(P)-dependent dehydrogenase (short-subunit alcohol dehydrogenase family)